MKRHLARKEVIINDPDYPAVSERLQSLVHECRTYRKGVRRLLLVQLLVHIIRNRRDEKLEWIAEELEACVEELSNARDRAIFHYLNRLPILRTEPRFHNRLRKDLKAVIEASEHLIQTINGKKYNDI